MTREEFFSRFKTALRARLSGGDAHDVLNDYDGFFDEKRAEGLSDEQICAELGEPEQIADEVALEFGSTRPPLNWKAPLAALLVAAFAFLGHASPAFRIDSGAQFNSLALLLGLLAVLLRGERYTRGRQSGGAWVSHLILFGLSGGILLLPAALMGYFQRYGLIISSFWGSFFGAVHYICLCAALVTAIVEMRRAPARDDDCRPVVFHAVAAIMCINAVENLLANLDQFEKFWLGLTVVCIIYVVFAGLCVLAPLASRRLRGLR